HTGPVLDIAFAPSGTRIATAGYDGQILVWRVTSDSAHLDFAIAAHDRPIQGIAYSPGDSLVSASWDGSVRVWSLKPDFQFGPLHLLSPVYGLAYDSSTRRLITAGNDGAVVWSITEGNLKTLRRDLFSHAS